MGVELLGYAVEALLVVEPEKVAPKINEHYYRTTKTPLTHDGRKDWQLVR
jgi:hypothetical protein